MDTKVEEQKPVSWWHGLFGLFHSWSGWRVIKDRPLFESNEDVRANVAIGRIITQVRYCKRCEYTQYKHTKLTN
jgi:hypothetical protein